MMTSTTTTTATTEPDTTDALESCADSNGFARFYFDTPFGSPADFAEIRKVIDRVVVAFKHEGHSELVGICISPDHFDLEIRSTDHLRTEQALLEVLPGIPFSDIDPDDDEDIDDDDWICDSCLAKMEAETVVQNAPSDPAKFNNLTLVERIKKLVAGLFRS